MIVTGVGDEPESGITIRSEVFSDVYDIKSEVGRYVLVRFIADCLPFRPVDNSSRRRSVNRRLRGVWNDTDRRRTERP